MGKYSIGVDIGGTFVDAILFNEETGETRLEKALTTPQDLPAGVLNAIDRLEIDLADTGIIVHGTTLGLNAIIERRGARTGIVTNEGFRDIFELGRGALPPEHAYNLHYQRPDPLVKRRCVAGVPGRINVSGEVEVELDEQAVVDTVNAMIAEQAVESIAICCLHSYKNPAHELQVARIIKDNFPTVAVSVSCRIAREYREFERTCTTVLDAYIRPIFEKYIDSLQSALEGRGFNGKFLVMRSSGGTMTATAAKQRPLDSVMSGPAGGIIGASYLAQRLNIARVLTMDFGGTSLDACVLDNAQPSVIHETRLQNIPVLVSSYDISCIGAGGGSIAWHEEGMLRLGPHSAGAEPGPIAYGRGGTQPTLTDAALLLGYIDADNFLKGQLRLDVAAAREGLETRLASEMETDVLQTAAGIFSVLVAQTEGAVREITVEQGKDPKELTILAYGGAGPMIAPLLALEMAIPDTIIPTVPAAFSAWGMLMSDLATDVSQTFLVEIKRSVLAELEKTLQALEIEARDNLAAQGAEVEQQTLLRFLEMRYLGQEHTLKIQVEGMPSCETLHMLFDAAHEQRYGHKTDYPLELVNLRVSGFGHGAKPELKKLKGTSADAGSEIPDSRRNAYCFADRKLKDFSVVERRRLRPGARLDGPAIIDDGTATAVIFTGQTCHIDDFGHLLIHTPGNING